MTSGRKPRPKSTKTCAGRILSWDADLDLSMLRGLLRTEDEQRFDRRTITVKAELLEPVDGCFTVELHAMNVPSGWSQSKNAPIATAEIKGSKIEITAILKDEELAMLLSLACSDRLRSLTFSYGNPTRRRSEVSSLRFSTKEVNAG